MSKKLLFNNSSTVDDGDSGGANGEIVIGTIQGYPSGDDWTDDNIILSTDKISLDGAIYVKIIPTDPNDTRRYYAYYIDIYDAEGHHLRYEDIASKDCTNDFAFVYGYANGGNYISVEIGTDDWTPITPDDVIVTYRCIDTSGGDGTGQEGDWVEADMRMGFWQTATELIPYNHEFEGTYLHSSEVIYTDGLKEVMVRGVNYQPQIGIGVYLFFPNGECYTFGILNDLINLDTNSLILADIADEYGITLAAIAFGVFAEENTASLRYKLIR